MSAPAAIRAVFAEWRMVKTRKVLALVFEVPLEQQGEVLTILGAPMPDAEIWCGIARLNLSATPPIPIRSNAAAADPRAGNTGVAPDQRGGTPHSARSEAGKQRYASAGKMDQALIRAARLPDDMRFRQWALPTHPHAGDQIEGPPMAIQFIRDTCCAGESRKLIAEDRDCYEAFLRMETSFLVETGVLAEPR